MVSLKIFETNLRPKLGEATRFLRLPLNYEQEHLIDDDVADWVRIEQENTTYDAIGT